jgi:hypothetical protein
MFSKRTFAGTLFATLAFGLLAINTQVINGQILSTGCGCLQPTCSSCNTCDCGQQNCATCQTVVVQACDCGVRSCRGGCRLGRRSACQRCPNCDNEVCVSETKTEKEKRSCWKTEQKVICIPKIRFPWQACDGPKCGKTKTITLLKKHDFECEVCNTTWKLVEPKLPEAPGESVLGTAANVLPPLPSMNQTIQPLSQSVQPLESVQPLPQTVQPVPSIPLQQPFTSQAQLNIMPTTPSTARSLKFESKIIPANTPLKIQGRPRGQ